MSEIASDKRYAVLYDGEIRDFPAREFDVSTPGGRGSRRTCSAHRRAASTLRSDFIVRTPRDRYDRGGGHGPTHPQPKQAPGPAVILTIS
eukprot:5479052-Prymnesium_polylepis.1